MDSRAEPTLPESNSPVWVAWLAFLRAYKVATENITQDLNDADLPSIVEYSVLYGLVRAEQNRIRQVDLARYVMLSKARVSRVLDGMVRMGVVERVPSSEDKRVTFAVLTEEGRRVYEKATPVFAAAFQRHFSERIDEADFDVLCRILTPVATP